MLLSASYLWACLASAEKIDEVIVVEGQCQGLHEKIDTSQESGCICELGYLRVDEQCVAPSTAWGNGEWNGWINPDADPPPPPPNPDGTGTPDPACTDPVLELKAELLGVCEQIRDRNADACSSYPAIPLCLADEWPSEGYGCEPIPLTDVVQCDGPNPWDPYRLGPKSKILGECIDEWTAVFKGEEELIWDACDEQAENEYEECVDRANTHFPQCQPEDPPLPAPDGDSLDLDDDTIAMQGGDR